MTIFVSHSQRDTEHLSFLNKAFSTTPGVDAKYEEIEAIDGDMRTGDRIKQDIQAAQAIFVLLTEHVESLKHTRDWVAWECGVGSDKGVWVFESPDSCPNVSVVVPRLNHYVAFRTTPTWLAYVRKLLKEMKRQGDRKKMAAGVGAIAAGYAVATAFGAVLGSVLLAPVVVLAGAAVMFNKMIEPDVKAGSIRCHLYECEKCKASYVIHREAVAVVRCPICNIRKSFSK